MALLVLRSSHPIFCIRRCFMLKLKILPDVNHWKQQVFSMSFDTVRIYVSLCLEYWHKNILAELHVCFFKIVKFLLVISKVFKQVRGSSLGNSLNLCYVLRRGSKNTQVSLFYFARSVPILFQGFGSLIGSDWLP